MTYCVAIHVDRGIVFASDSRTNAGVDYVTTYSKMHLFTPQPDRLFVLLSAGNLATTQEVMNRIQRDLEDPHAQISLRTTKYLFEAARYVGAMNSSVVHEHADELQQSGFNAEATFILGGQIQGHPPAIFLIYPQGNYVSASPETPYLQIGESKYGKPILDRIIDPTIELEDAARCALVSLDSTMRSNISVGPPIELSIYPTDGFHLSHRVSLRNGSQYFASIQKQWNIGLREAFDSLPPFDWELGENV